MGVKPFMHARIMTHKKLLGNKAIQVSYRLGGQGSILHYLECPANS